MSGVFGAEYAQAYDALYAEKDYEAECDILERYFGGGAERVLDLGSGTGGHALVLARRGYAVTGIDRSPEMVGHARAKAAAAGVEADFRVSDIRDVDLGERFDAVIVMFAVLGYLNGDSDLHRGLGTARRHLEPGGALLFDVWYGPAVLAERPSDRTKVVETPEGRIERRSSGELDEVRRLCLVRFDVVDERGGTRAELHEEHVMRYFDEAELVALLDEAGFELVDLRAFPEVDERPSERSWSVLAVARARDVSTSG